MNLLQKQLLLHNKILVNLNYLLSNVKECRYGSYEKVYSDNKLIINEYAQKLFYHLKDNSMDELFDLRD